MFPSQGTGSLPVKKVVGVQKSQLIAVSDEGAATEPQMTVFVCANCACAGLAPSARLGQPSVPAFPWKGAVKEIVVPCMGRLQPEHLLKAFEAGADAVGVVACAEGNCHYVEGSCRAGRRCDYVGDLLEEIGLGRGRLMLFHLPGSAREDMAIGAPGAPGGAGTSEAALAAQVVAIAGAAAERLAKLAPSPLRDGAAGGADSEVSEPEETEENED